MKKNKRLLSLVLAVFMLFTSPAYFYDPVEVNAASTTRASVQVKNQTKSLTMVKGQKTTIKPPVKMTYSSSNSKVASVSSKGLITAKAKGSATITGKYKKIKWTYKIKVDQPKLNKTSLSLYTGQSYQLKFSGTTRKATWSSSNKFIAAVSKSGKISAKKPGTIYITAKINGVSYKCKLTVKSKTQTTVWLSATGSKYHKIPNCGKMNPAKARKVDLSYAKAHHYTPCSKCFK